jgi:hypothetical protein
LLVRLLCHFLLIVYNF